MKMEDLKNMNRRIHTEFFKLPLLTQEEMKNLALSVWGKSPGTLQFYAGQTPNFIDKNNSLTFGARFLKKIEFDGSEPLIGNFYKKNPDEVEFYQTFLKYSSFISIAWEIVESLSKQFNVNLESNASAGLWVFKIRSDTKIVDGFGETAPIAICNATLKLVEDLK